GHGRLMVLDAADRRQLQPQLRVDPARKDVFEAAAVLFDAVHEDQADPGEGVVVELAYRLGDELLPGEDLSVQRGPALVEQVEAHGGKSWVEPRRRGKPSGPGGPHHRRDRRISVATPRMARWPPAEA